MSPFLFSPLETWLLFLAKSLAEAVRLTDKFKSVPLVRRSKRAAVIFSSPKIAFQSPNRRFVVTMIETRLYRSLQNWNKFCSDLC